VSGRLARNGRDAQLRRRFAEREASQRQQADVIRRLLLEGKDAVVPAGEREAQLPG